MSDMEDPDHSSLEEETEEASDPPHALADEASHEGSPHRAGGVRMISEDGEELDVSAPPALTIDPEQSVEYLYNEPPPQGIEGLDFDFLQSFLSLTDDLHQHPDVARVTRTMDRPVPEFTIRVVETGLGQKLAHDLKSLYRIMDELSFRWESRPGQNNATLPGGALQIVPFMRTFGHWVGELWPLEDADAHQDDVEAQLH